MTSQPLAYKPNVREKLLTHGAKSLSDTELMAVFISSGNASRSNLELAHALMEHLGDARAIFNTDLKTFQEVPGIGIVRYVQLQAIQELCRRSDLISLKKDTQLTNTQQTQTFLKRQLRDKKNETFVALFLDSQNRVLSYEELFTGTINTASVHTRPIIERILKLNAAALIVAHNHPSGLADPSDYDLVFTERLKNALDLVDAQLLDHLIIGDNEVYSIMEQIKWQCN